MKKPTKAAPLNVRRAAAIESVDLREVAECTSLRLRRASRKTTQAFDAIIAPSGLTGGQFGLLAQLHGAQKKSKILPLGTLADLVGMDPTTLTRNLKPLEKLGLVLSTPHPNDGRIRCLMLTKLGESRVNQTAPLWKRAQQRLRRKLGADVISQLDALLDKLTEQLERS